MQSGPAAVKILIVVHESFRACAERTAVDLAQVIVRGVAPRVRRADT